MRSAKSQRKKVESLAEGRKAVEERNKAEAIKLLQEKFDLPKLEAVIQRGSSDSTYELKLADGNIIVLGNAYEIHQQAKVRARLFDAGARMLKHSSDKWDEVLNAIRGVAEVIETLTEAEELRSYVLGIIGVERSTYNNGDEIASVDFSDDDKDYLLKRLNDRKHRGFYDYQTGIVYLPLSSVTNYLNFNSGRRWSRREVVALLTRHGFAYKQKSVRYTDKEGVSKTFNVGTFWTSPDGYYLKDKSESAC